MKTYIDILMISNAMITIALNKLVSLILHAAISRKRLLLGGLFGAVCSLIILIKSENIIEALLITLLKLIIMTFTVRIVFNITKIRRLINYAMCYTALNIVFGGICIAVWELFGAGFIRARNMTVYFNVPLWLLIICTAASYVIISVYEKIKLSADLRSQKFKAVYTYNDYSIELPAISDTGNKLTDSFSGEPVVVFSSDKLYDHFDLDNESSYSTAGFHLIPYSTVSATSLMPVTLKGKTIITDSNMNKKEIRCAVGIVKGNGKERAIFDPKLLI